MSYYFICILGFLLFILYIAIKDDPIDNCYSINIGNIGEGIVSKKLIQLDDNYVVENDIELGGQQIDHLVINHSLQLCFVIETKYWSGTITGERNDTYWIQSKVGQADKYLYNPIKQNSKHCSTVRKYYPNYHVHGVVVFVRNKNVPHNRSIVGENELVEYINKVSKKVYNRYITDG
jgi:hypothetical protein